MSGPLSTARWRRLRAAILNRDGHLCQMHGPHCTTTATTVDHIVERAAGGDMWDETNLRAACAPCNYGSGAAMGNRQRQVTEYHEPW